MVRWIDEQLSDVRPEDIALYAESFYDNKCASMKRVAAQIKVNPKWL